MSVLHAFNEFFFKALPRFNHIWLSYGVKAKEELPEERPNEIFIEREDMPRFLQTLKQFKGVKQIRLNDKYGFSQVELFMEGSVRLVFKVLHTFVHGTLQLADDKQLKRHVITSDEGVKYPQLPYFFEYTVQKQFLNRQGLTDEQIRYFEDFEPLVQQDLLDSWNAKYHTDFVNISDMGDYQAGLRATIIKRLKVERPRNFTQLWNMRFHQMRSFLRQAKMI